MPPLSVIGVTPPDFYFRAVLPGREHGLQLRQPVDDHVHLRQVGIVRGLTMRKRPSGAMS